MAIKRIGSNLDSPKIIILLREPVSRTISHYKWLYASGIENRSLSNAINESGYLFDPELPIEGNYTGYIEFSSYSKWVPKWQKSFGAENVLLLKSEDLRKSPDILMRQCAAFLGVKDIDWVILEESNKTENIMMRNENKISKFVKSMMPKTMKKKIKEAVPLLTKYWNDKFISLNKRQTANIADNELLELRNLLSDECDYYYSLFEKAK